MDHDMSSEKFYELLDGYIKETSLQYGIELEEYTESENESGSSSSKVVKTSKGFSDTIKRLIIKLTERINHLADRIDAKYSKQKFNELDKMRKDLENQIKYSENLKGKTIEVKTYDKWSKELIDTKKSLKIAKTAGKVEMIMDGYEKKKGVSNGKAVVSIGVIAIGALTTIAYVLGIQKGKEIMDTGSKPFSYDNFMSLRYDESATDEKPQDVETEKFHLSYVRAMAKLQEDGMYIYEQQIVEYERALKEAKTIVNRSISGESKEENNG